MLVMGDMSIQDFLAFGWSCLTNPQRSKWLALSLILFETVLCGLIIWKVSYTEIDYKAYLQQVAQFLDGERNYRRIRGDTGPLVYPAVHVYIYTILYWLTAEPDKRPIINRCKGQLCIYEGEVNIVRATLIFACLYLLTVATVIACYRKVGAPGWLLIPLVLSKRLHSIFVLRLFNDAWATLGFWLAIHAFQRKKWTIGVVLWTLGLGVKMTLLVTAPAIGAILIQGAGLADAVYLGFLSLVLQLLAATPFLRPDDAMDYFNKAFEFSRQFLFKWTVNWRFIEEEMFLSREFALSLLVMHITLLLVFMQSKWLRLSSTGIVDFIRRWVVTPMDDANQQRASNKVTPTFVMDAMLGSMAIGLLCARSLHYQFFSYLGWASPYLLWRAGSNPIWVFVNWAAQEYAWNVFPSTNLSSGLVVLQLALQVLSALAAPPVDHIAPPSIVLQPAEAVSAKEGQTD